MNLAYLYRKSTLLIVLSIFFQGGCATVDQLDQRSSFLSYRIETSGKELTALIDRRLEESHLVNRKEMAALTAGLADLKNRHEVNVQGLTEMLRHELNKIVVTQAATVKQMTQIAAEIKATRQDVEQMRADIEAGNRELIKNRLGLERNLSETERNKTEIQLAAMEIALNRVALKRFQEELQRREQEIKSLSAQVVNMGREAAASQSVNANLVADVSTFKDMLMKFNGILETFQKSQVQVNASLHSQLKNLLQTHQSTIDAMAATKERLAANYSELAKNIDQISMRLESLTKHLDLEEKIHPPAGKGVSAAVEKASVKPSDADKGPSLEAMYDLAYRAFKQGNYDKARLGFQELLNRFPRGELPENAQFLIAETFFFEKNYERAIVEYEKVLSDHPGGLRTAHALVKQGMSFQALGDNVQAKLFFEQVLRDFPHSTQARTARSRLAKLN